MRVLVRRIGIGLGCLVPDSVGLSWNGIADGSVGSGIGKFGIPELVCCARFDRNHNSRLFLKSGWHYVERSSSR